LISVLLSTFIAVAPFDHSPWDQFLKKFVNDKGKVNYAAAQKDPSLLDAYLQKIKEIPAGELEGWLREERMALWINAFNAGVVRLVLKHYPAKTVMEIPGFWEEQAIEVGTQSKEKGGKANLFSLGQIEDNILRQSFRDEKILFALSKGARGSPRLRPEAYNGPQLEGQLYLATREFVNREDQNQIDPVKKKVVLSRIFKWHAADFLFNWGDFPEPPKWRPEEMAVLSFFAHYLEDPKKVEFLKEGEYKVKYETFDWDLNAQR